MKIVLHSYTFRGYSIEKAFFKAAEYGYDGIELSTVHYKTESDLLKAANLSKQYQVPIIALDAGTDLLNSEKAAASIEKMKWALDMAHMFNVPIINGSIANITGPDWTKFAENGSALVSQEKYQEMALMYQEVADYAQAKKVQIVFEIHMNTPHDTGESTLKLLDAIGSNWVNANPDPGNIYATTSSEGPLGTVQKVKGKIGFFHAKNCRRSALGYGYDYSYLLENGAIDYYQIVCELIQQGYDGPICIEYCGEGDPAYAAYKDITYLRSLIADALLTNCLK